MQLGSVRARARPTHTHSHTHNTQNWGHTRFFPLGYAGPQACFSTCKLPQICCHKAAFHLSVVANLLPQGSFPLVSCRKFFATRQLSTCQLSQICCHKAAFHLSVAKNVLPQGSFPLGSCPNSGTKSQFPHTYTSTNQLPHICSHKAAFPFVSCPNSDTKKQFPHTYRYVHILPQISCHISVATRQLFINLYFNKSMTSFLFSSVIFSRSLISTIVATSQLPHASMSPLPLSWCHKPSGI